MEAENVLSILENSLGNIGRFFLGIFLGYLLVFKKERVQHTQVGELESTAEQHARYYADCRFAVISLSNSNRGKQVNWQETCKVNLLATDYAHILKEE